MTQATLGKLPSVSPHHFTWFEAWLKAVTQPSVATFSALVADPAATSGRAYRWAALASVAGYLLAAPLLLRGYTDQGGQLVLGLALAPIIGLLGLALVAGWPHSLARRLGGRGELDDLEYAFSAWCAPLLLLVGLAALAPAFALIAFLGLLYGLALGVIGVRAVHGLSWRRSIVAMLPGVLGCLLVALFARPLV